MIKWLLSVGIVFLLAVAGYVYFTATDTLEVQEASPLQINDNMDTMTAAEKEAFQKAVDEATEKVMVMDDTKGEAANLLAQGEFKPRAHDVAGKALLIQSGDMHV